MSKVLEFLEQELSKAQQVCKSIEDEISSYKSFIAGTTTATVKIQETKTELPASEIQGKVTFVSQIQDALKSKKKELTSGDIAEIILPYHAAKGKDLKWVKNRLGNVLAEAVNAKNKIYSSPHTGRSKVYGLYMFKGSDGNVKDEHKYESTL